MWSAPPNRVWGLLAHWGLLAQVRIDWELVLLAVVLAGVIAGGIVLINRTRQWRLEQPPPVSLDDQLQSFQTLVDRGELDPKEFEKIKARLEQQAAAPPETRPETRQDDRIGRMDRTE
jgi:hypothetical protein